MENEIQEVTILKFRLNEEIMKECSRTRLEFKDTTWTQCDESGEECSRTRLEFKGTVMGEFQRTQVINAVAPDWNLKS